MSSHMLPATKSYHTADCQPKAPILSSFNALPNYLKSLDLSFVCFKQQLKTFLYYEYWQLALLKRIRDFAERQQIYWLIWDQFPIQK